MHYCFSLDAMLMTDMDNLKNADVRTAKRDHCSALMQGSKVQSQVPRYSTC
jgi:hypothetical protein